MEDDDVALRLTAELNRGKCGRVSFMPLNRMNPGAVQYPEQYGSDVVPLLRKLKYDAKFEPAFRQVRAVCAVCCALRALCALCALRAACLWCACGAVQ